jgi:hypothetical protein
MANDIDEDDDAEHAKLEAAIQAIVDGEPAGDQAEHVALLMQWLKDQPEAEREKLTRAAMRYVYEDIVAEIEGDE